MMSVNVGILLLLYYNVVQIASQLVLIDDPMQSASGAVWTTKTNIGTETTSWCPSQCVRLGWNGDEGNMQRSITNIADYISFDYEFYVYLKSFGSGTTDDYCHFRYHFDSDGEYEPELYNTADTGQVLTGSFANQANKTLLYLRFATSNIENGENCYFRDFKITAVTLAPTLNPTTNPTTEPTIEPTTDPTTDTPTTVEPTQYPTDDPTIYPTSDPLQMISTEYGGGSVADTTQTENTDAGQQGNGNNKSLFEEHFILFLIIICVLVLLCIAINVCLCKRHKNKQKTQTIKARMDEEQNETVNVGRVNSTSYAELTIRTPTSDVKTVNAVDTYSNNNTLRFWLNNIGLDEYLNLFMEQGFGDNIDQMEALSQLNDNDLQGMGIRKLAHRKLILSQINKNKHQIDKLNSNENGNVNVMITTNTQQVTINGEEDSDDYSGQDLFEVMHTNDTTTKTTGQSMNMNSDSDSSNDIMYDKPTHHGKTNGV